MDLSASTSCRRTEYRKALQSPAVYAAVVEGLLEKVEARLVSLGLPAGLPLSSELSPMEVEAYRTAGDPFRQGDVFAINFADDTYLLARSPTQCSFVTAVVRQEYAEAGQHLHGGKSQVISTEEQPVRMWTDIELDTYIATRGRNFRSDSPKVPQVGQATVLGSCLSICEPTHAPLQARKCAAWLCYSRS